MNNKKESVFRIRKGEYGYINKRKKIQIIYTLASFAAALGVFCASYFISGNTRNNVGTVLAIVMTLPACKSLVGVILIFPYKTIDREIYDKINEYGMEALMLYDLVLTSNDKPMCVDVAAIGENSLVMLVMGVKQDRRYIENYFQKVMDAYGLDAEVSVCEDVEKFTELAMRPDNVSDNAKEIEKTVLTFGF